MYRTLPITFFYTNKQNIHTPIQHFKNSRNLCQKFYTHQQTKHIQVRLRIAIETKKNNFIRKFYTND